MYESRMMESESAYIGKFSKNTKRSREVKEFR
jgi:hypothetical protein